MGAINLTASIVIGGEGTLHGVESGCAFSRPLVSIEFDDGWGTSYRLGLPMVESYGWTATQNIITDTAANNDGYATGSYMTPAEIQDWNRRGDIGSHSVMHRHVKELSENEMFYELAASKEYLDHLLGQPTNLYVSPYGESSDTAVEIAKDRYQSVRNCCIDINSAANFDRWDLKSFVVLNTTLDTEIISLLDKAKCNNGWVIFVWHEINGDTRSNPWSVSQATLKRQLQLIKNSGLEVVLTQNALDISLGLQTAP